MSALPSVVLAIVVGWLWPPPDAWYQPVLLALGAIAPDLDRVIGAFSPRLAAKTFRGAGHSLPALAIWTLALAGAFHAIDPAPGLGTAVALAAIGVSVHTLVDLASPAGIALFGRRRIGYGVLAPTDAALFVLPVLALGLGTAWPSARLALATGTSLLLLYFVGLRLAMRRRALGIGEEVLGRPLLGVFPTPWSPLQWIGIAQDGEARLVLPIDVSKKRGGTVRRYEPPPRGPIVEALEATGAVLGRGDGRWIVDLRYAYPWPVVVAGIEEDEEEEGKVRTLRLP